MGGILRIKNTEHQQKIQPLRHQFFYHQGKNKLLAGPAITAFIKRHDFFYDEQILDSKSRGEDKNVSKFNSKQYDLYHFKSIVISLLI